MRPTPPNDHKQNQIAACTVAHGGMEHAGGSARRGDGRSGEAQKKAYSFVRRHLTTGTLMFDLDRFVAACRAALAQDASHKAIREVVARAVADPNAVLARLGEPKRGGIDKLHHAG